ncbi:hypothetical protein CEXT_571741 [Caerostris extrusa]|uniref:Uncharacterized protein n=1 Tax=Caerostris extrusa TaxID=172846 RepID=A0AAV4PHF0_CAEEX|nr:hypothetical protein CEXT_571741 [Caerostris extrusa]
MNTEGCRNGSHIRVLTRTPTPLGSSRWASPPRCSGSSQVIHLLGYPLVAAREHREILERSWPKETIRQIVRFLLILSLLLVIPLVQESLHQFQEIPGP